MLRTNVLEIARKMRGRDNGRVMVLDIDYASRKYGVYLGVWASRHAYYLRPPPGMIAADLKKILDQSGGEEGLAFRYYIYPELETDLKPLLTADPFAEKHFPRNEEVRYLQIEGERPQARETIAILLEAFKEPFKPEDFPRINEFALKSFKPHLDDGRSEMVLLRKDGKRDEVRKSEPGFHIAMAEHGYEKEIEIHRPVVAETEPMIILNSNSATTDSGYKFLSDMAAYFGGEAYAEQSKLSDLRAAELSKQAAAAAPSPSHTAHIPRAPTIQPTHLNDQQLLTKVVASMKELMPGMALLRKREVSRSGHYLTIQFPGKMGFGKGPSEQEIKELHSIFRALKGDPSFGADWRALYQVDKKTGELKISLDAAHSQGWTPL